MKNKSILEAILVLGPCIALHSIAMDIFVPCVPSMELALQTSFSKVQWALSIFVLATGLGQVIMGPLTDRYGRRWVMLISILAFLLSTIACSIAPNIEILIAARLIQGLASCGTSVATVTVVRDVFDEENRTRVYSYINGVIALAPLLAPLLGGYLLIKFGTWRSTFHFISIFTLVTFFIAYWRLHETKPLVTTDDFKPSDLVANYKELFTDKVFISFAFCACTALTALFLFFSVSSVLLIKVLGVSETKFGYYFGFNAAVYMIACFFTPKFKHKIGIENTIIVGSALIFMGSAMMLGWNFIYGLSKLGLMLPNAIITFGVGLIFGPCAAAGLAAYKHMAGTASAVYGTIEYSGAALVGALVMSFNVESTFSLGFTLFIMGGINILLIMGVKRWRTYL